jgi:hypothetical protein
MNKTYIILLIIFIEIIYLIYSKEILSEKIDHIYSNEGFKSLKIISTIFIIFLIIIIYYISKYIEKVYKINKYVCILFIIITFLSLIEYKLSTNINYSNVTNNIDDEIDKLTTGDFVLFRSYHSYDIPELFFYRCISSLFSKIYFGHIGIIIKINNISYILESTEDYYNCEYSKKYKNGFILHKAYNRIKNYDGRIYISKNNLHEYINNDQIYTFCEKYKDLSFNNIGCCKFVITFLYHCNIIKYNYLLLLQYDIINKINMYNVDYIIYENIKIKNHV